MKKFWRFGDTLVNENNTSELKARIKEDYTFDKILDVIEEWHSIGDLLESLDNYLENQFFNNLQSPRCFKLSLIQ